MKNPDKVLRSVQAALHANNLAEAETLCRSVVAAHPKRIDALSLLGETLRAKGDSQQAVAVLRKAVALGKSGDTMLNLAACLMDLGELAEARNALDEVLRLGGNRVIALINIAIIEERRGNLAEAAEAAREAIRLNPAITASHLILAKVHAREGRMDQHRDILLTALKITPDPVLYEELATAAFTRDFSEAEQYFRAALKLNPRSPSAMFGLATCLDKQSRHHEAIEVAQAIPHPDAATVALLMNQRRRIGDWSRFDADEAALRAEINADRLVNPFLALVVDSTREEQLRCARNWARKWMGDIHPMPPRPHDRRPRIRVGYLSADLHEHATAYLMADLWEHHDRSRFEVFAYSYGPDDGSAMRQRLVRAFEHFIDVGGELPAQTAQRIRDDGIDILIDLKGYTGGARTEIMAYRPAPVQMQFLGYPGTMGVPFIDYVVADRFIVPPAHEADYAEKLIRLPHCYQPNDRQRRIADAPLSRAAFGLPEDAFVFCSFNSTYKITPAMFDTWMRLLEAVPGSVLWLLEWSPQAVGNLKAEAAKRGVDPARLVFGRGLRLPEHLARHRLADLFLDTLPVNAHTTASDSLWAGLPVLTCAGDSFVSRVAGSLLTAMGLPELVTTSLAEYEAMALRLAREPGLLASLKARLDANRLTAPLFDIERFTRDLERAYEQAHDLWLSGQPPRSFNVESQGDMESQGHMDNPGDAPPPARQPAQAVDGRILYQACPLCGHGEIAVIQQADISSHPAFKPVISSTMTWCRCGGCGHLFTQGYLAPEAELALFDPADHTRKVGFDLENQRALAARTVSRVARHKAAGRWLDADAGTAALMFTAEEWGFQVAGLDRDPANVQTLRQLGYPADQLSLEQVEGAGLFEIISMMGVLETTPFPRPVLAAAARLLTPGGLLVLSAANAEAMLWRVLNVTTGNPFWADITRAHQFGRGRLAALLAEFGFQVVEYDVSDRIRVGMEIIARRNDG